MRMDMNGKICLVSGATAGIGKAVALGLATRGATVVIVARNAAKAEAAIAEIKAQSGNEQIDALLADLASQASIRQLAERFKSQHQRLHVLVNIAGVYQPTRTVSPDGLELMFATNHLGYFLLTNLLLDMLKASAPSTILNVTAPSTTKLDFDDLQGERRFRSLRAFGASKMGNLLFTFALARQLEGGGVTVNAYHPGLVRTDLMRPARIPMRWLFGLLNRFAVTPERAAEGLVQLAAANAGGTSGQLFHGDKVIDASSYARDEQVQERLWAESARLVSLQS